MFLKLKNPPGMLRRVNGSYINAHIINSSPESKYENDDVMMFYSTFLKNMNANIAKN
jgi:hypothetical protein